jgi:hypothetical protein
LEFTTRGKPVSSFILVYNFVILFKKHIFGRYNTAMPSRPAGRPTTILAAALIAFFLAIGPVVIAFLSTPQAYVFGGFLFNPLDGNSYLAKMYSGWSGSWRYTFPYTAAETPGGYLFLFYLFLGHVARIFHLPLLGVYHLARAVGAGLMLWALWAFLRSSLPERRAAEAAFILAALGSGLGWLVVLAGEVSTDLWVAEAYPFLSAYATPHFSLGLALLLGLLRMLLLPEPERWWMRAGQAAAAAALLAVLSPFGVVIALVVGSAFWGWEAAAAWRQKASSLGTMMRSQRTAILTLGAAAAGSAPLLAYYAWLPGSDPVIAGWNAQNLTPTPPAWDLLLAFSPALLLAGTALARAVRSETPGTRLLAVWLVIGFVLLLLPLGLQRRFIMGLYVPAAGLAGFSLAHLAQRWPRGWKRLGALALALPLPTLLFLLLGAALAFSARNPLFFLTQDEYQALDWLRKQAPAGSAVAAPPDMGMYIPGYTGLRVVYGHPFETVNAEAEEAALEAFFFAGPQDEAEACLFLMERQVDYVLYTRLTRMQAYPPTMCLAPQPVFSNRIIDIHQVEH